MHNPEEFNKELDTILENVEAIDCFTDAMSVLERLNQARQAVSTVEAEHKNCISGLNSQLAGEIMKAQPGLTVRLGRDGNVIVTYARGPSKQMVLTADPSQRRWNVGDSAFERNYVKYYGNTLAQPDLPAIGSSIARYFTNSFKTLKGKGLAEEIYGKGKLIVEDEVNTNTVPGAGVLNRLNAAYGELKAAYEFAQRSELGEEIIKDINKMGSDIINLAKKLEATKDDTEDIGDAI